MPAAKPLAVTVKLPFCPNTCQYCSYSSDLDRALLMGPYCEALCHEAEQSAADMGDYRVTSVYLGAGAASYVKAERVVEVLGVLHDRFVWDDDVETTLRVLPGYINEFRIRDYLRAGVTKADVDWHMGWFDRSRLTGRACLPEQERVTFKALAHYGLVDVGVEVLYGLPGQTAGEWAQVLDDAFDLGVKHVSASAFEPHEGTVQLRELANLRTAYGDRAEFRCATGDELDEMCGIAVEKLGAAGFAEYLPGRFALPGHERRHLLDEAAGIDRLELGSAAHSHIDGIHTRNVADPAEYVVGGGDVERVLVRAWEEVR